MAGARAGAGQAEDPERQAAADPGPLLTRLGQPLRDGAEAARRAAREDALRPQVGPARGAVAARQGGPRVPPPRRFRQGTKHI